MIIKRSLLKLVNWYKKVWLIELTGVWTNLTTGLNEEIKYNIMTKNQEDTMYEIHTKLDKLNLHKEFHAQLKKMYSQEKHNWKNLCEKWEYAFNKVKNKAK